MSGRDANQLAADVREHEDYAEAFLTGETKRRYLELVARVGTLQRQKKELGENLAEAFQRGRRAERNERDSARQAAVSHMENLLSDERRRADKLEAQVGTLQHELDEAHRLFDEETQHLTRIERRAETAEVALAAVTTQRDAAVASRDRNRNARLAAEAALAEAQDELRRAGSRISDLEDEHTTDQLLVSGLTRSLATTRQALEEIADGSWKRFADNRPNAIYDVAEFARRALAAGGDTKEPA